MRHNFTSFSKLIVLLNVFFCVCQGLDPECHLIPDFNMHLSNDVIDSGLDHIYFDIYDT